jgi:hypothetical protein
MITKRCLLFHSHSPKLKQTIFIYFFAAAPVALLSLAQTYGHVRSTALAKLNQKHNSKGNTRLRVLMQGRSMVVGYGFFWVRSINRF